MNIFGIRLFPFIFLLIFSFSINCLCDEKSTVVVPHTGGVIVEGKNTVYCPTFQMAWDSFRSDILKGEPILFQKSVPLAGILNKSPYKAENLFPESFFAKSAFIGPLKFEPDIRKEFIGKFGEALKDFDEMVGKVRTRSSQATSPSHTSKNSSPSTHPSTSSPPHSDSRTATPQPTSKRSGFRIVQAWQNIKI